jgi:hypothetical protein
MGCDPPIPPTFLAQTSNASRFSPRSVVPVIDARERAGDMIHYCFDRTDAPDQSAMSMLTFTINRAGKNPPKSRLDVLNRTKAALREVFGRT